MSQDCPPELTVLSEPVNLTVSEETTVVSVVSDPTVLSVVCEDLNLSVGTTVFSVEVLESPVVLSPVVGEVVTLSVPCAVGPPGPAGADGVASWDVATSYSSGDVIYYDGVFYEALQASTGDQPDVSPLFWSAVTSGGGGVSIGDAVGSATARRVLTTDGSSDLTDTDFKIADLSLFGGLVTGKTLGNVDMSSTNLGFIDATAVGGDELIAFVSASGVAGSFAFADVDTLNVYYQIVKDASNELGFQVFTLGSQVDGTPDLMVTNSGMKLYNGATINEFSTDGTLADNSDVAVPTEQAVKTYVDGEISPLDTRLDTAEADIDALELLGDEPRDKLNGLFGLQDRSHYALLGGGPITQYDGSGGFRVDNPGDFADGGCDIYNEYVPLWQGVDTSGMDRFTFQEIFTIEDDLAWGGDLVETAICWDGRNPTPFFEITAADSAVEDGSGNGYGEYPTVIYENNEYNGEMFMLQRVRYTYDPSTGAMTMYRPALRFETPDSTAFGIDWIVADVFTHQNPGSHPIAPIDPTKKLLVGKGSGKYLVSRVIVNSFDGTPYCDFNPVDNTVDELTVYDPVLDDNWVNDVSSYAKIIESEDFALNMLTDTSLVESVNTQTGVVVLDPDDLDDTSTTNKFTNATDISKLAGIEALADVTDSTNVDSAGAVMEADTSTASMSFVIDEDDMVSDLDTKVPTQQSVKAYVDNQVPTPTTVVTPDTKANILALTPTSPQVAFATDTKELFLWDGTNWQIASLKLNEESANPDIGFTQDNDKNGYGEDYLHNKKATDFGIGDFTGAVYNGAFKLDHNNSPATLEIYARDTWNRLFYDFQMSSGDLEHKPTDEFTIDVRSGNSNEVGLNDVPIVQEYSVDVGCYPYPTVIDGGSL